MPHRILIAGYIGFGNAGDEAIAQAVTGHLREQLPDAEITIISGDPPATAKAYGVHAIAWRDPLALTDAVRTTDLTILGGGGLFQDYWGFDPAAILTREHWGLSFYVTPALLSGIFGKPCMLYAVGAGPLLSEHGRKYTKVAGDIAARVTVRDLVTKELFESLGVCPDKIVLTADPAFDLTPAPELPDSAEVREWKSGGPAIAVCLRTWNFGADSTFSDREVAGALDAVLGTEGGRILFVPFGGADDIYVARRVRNQMRCAEQSAILEEPCTPDVLARIVAESDLVLGMRLHSVIFSVAAQTPFVALEYDPKVGGIVSMIGLEEFAIPFGGIEADLLAARMRRALEEKERFQELAPLAADLRGRARQNAVIAAELLEQPPAITDYGPDARTLIGRLVKAQVSSSESLLDRFERCAELLGQPLQEVRPLAMADGVVSKVKEVQAQTRGWEEARTQLTGEAARLKAELHEARVAADAAQRRAEDAAREAQSVRERLGELQELRRDAAAARERFDQESRRAAQLSSELAMANSARQQAEARVSALSYTTAAIERRIAVYEAKTFGGIAKRGLQVFLDFCQILTPGPLRSAVRKYYLNWFYFRVYPERRPAQSRES